MTGVHRNHFSFRDKAVDIFGSHYFVNHLSVPVDEKEGGISCHGIGLHEFFSGWALCIHFEVNEKGIIEITQFFLWKYSFRHVFAGTTPFGVDIHEDCLVFSLGLSQDFIPRARFKFYSLCVACHASDKYTYE